MAQGYCPIKPEHLRVGPLRLSLCIDVLPLPFTPSLAIVVHIQLLGIITYPGGHVWSWLVLAELNAGMFVFCPEGRRPAHDAVFEWMFSAYEYAMGGGFRNMGTVSVWSLGRNRSRGQATLCPPPYAACLLCGILCFSPSPTLVAIIRVFLQSFLKPAVDNRSSALISSG